MALSDTWHRTLVYFGLAEERDPYASASSEPEAELEGRYRERGSVRRLSRSRGGDVDEIFTEEEFDVRRSPRARNGGSSGGSVHLVIPKSFNDAQQVADKFRDGVPVVLNLQSTDTELSKRLIDFTSGLTYGLDGGMQKIADKVFMLTPRDVEISAEARAELIEKGFFNQS
ncbi:MAG: cell division protein SepF [Acidobacteria bacterium]|nr:cell division protein SepF [Solirubrobacteraceae bacterium]MBU6336886.1 cell division protein SepF [Acidobacteriota bacterium]